MEKQKSRTLRFWRVVGGDSLVQSSEVAPVMQAPMKAPWYSQRNPSFLRTRPPIACLRLSDGIKAGVQTFLELGMQEAYTGDPSASTVTFGNELYHIMSEMVVTTVTEHLRSLP